MRLQDLDDKLVPRAAVALRRLVDGTGGRVRSLRSGSGLPADGPLQRLDARYARSGPLGLVREVPQVGYFVLALLLVVASAVALVRSQEQAREPGRGGLSVSLDPAQPGAVSPLLGPQVGASTDTYVRDAEAELAVESGADGDRRFVALVSFETYLRAEAAAPLVEGVLSRQAFLRVPLKSGVPELLSPEVVDLEDDLVALQSATAKRKDVDKKEFSSLADSIDPRSKEEETFKSFYVSAAAIAASEAAAYRRGCACVFGVVVEGRASDLAEVASRPGVRVVELAARGLPLDVVSVSPPLLPGATGVVKDIPRQAALG